MEMKNTIRDNEQEQPMVENEIQLRSKQLIPEREDDWSDFLCDTSGGTAFHTLNWKRTVERSMGYEPRYRLWYRDNEAVGAVPGFGTPEILGNSILVPFCSHSSPVLATDVDVRKVLTDLRDIYRDRFETRILKEQKGSSNHGYHAEGYGAVRTGVTFRLPVTVSFDALWDDLFQPSLRQKVRTAEDCGVTVTESDELGRYYDLYLRTMRRLGSPQLPRSFFEALSVQFDEDFHFQAAHRDGEMVAGIIAFDHDDTRYLWSAASDPTAWQYRPNEAVYAEIIRDACEGAPSEVDFGRTEPGSGVYDFKTQFGADERALASFVYPPHRARQASISSYKRLAPLTKRAAGIITHPAVGPRIKRWIHE